MVDMACCLKPDGMLLLTTPNYNYVAITRGDDGPFSTTEDGWHVRRGYTATDLRYGRQLGRGVELSIDGQNIFGSGHGEFTNIATRTQFKPEVFVKLECRF